MRAQLRDVLTAENSTVVAKEDHRSRVIGPQRPQAESIAVNIRKRNTGQFAAERISHGEILIEGYLQCQVHEALKKAMGGAGWPHYWNGLKNKEVQGSGRLPDRKRPSIRGVIASHRTAIDCYWEAQAPRSANSIPEP